MIQRVYGADPEFGILIDNILTPPAKLFELGLPYTTDKNNKKVIVYKPEIGKVIEDGVSFEINLNPVQNPVLVHYNANILISEAYNVIKQFWYSRTHGFTPISISHNCLEEFDFTKFLENKNELYNDCRVFRCEQDFYPTLYRDLGLETEDGILDASKHGLRYFGGHLHLQNMSDNPDVYINNAEYSPIVFDFLVGLTNVLNITKENKSNEVNRMKVYGRPGRGRIQVYSKTVNGYEYRPPSNNWLFNLNSCKNLYTMANIAANIVENNLAESFVEEVYTRVPNMWEAILYMNTDLATSLRKSAVSLALKLFPIKLKDAKSFR